MLRLRQSMRMLAPVWLLFISFLFFLPGSALPSGGLFDIPFLDKYVHIGFFAVLLFTWRFYFGKERKFSLYLLVIAFVYGTAVEVVQHYFVANRAFDLTDIAADMIGSIVGLLAWQQGYKKIDPCRNRGRNQN